MTINILKKIKNRFFRFSFITLSIVLLFVAIVIIFISPIAKYLVEKYSEKYIGRKVEMSWLYVNPFTGSVNAHNLIIFEKGRKEIAAKTGNLSANITLGKLFYKTYELSSVTLDNLWLNVIQDSTKFNFDDLLMSDTVSKVNSAAVHFRICNIRIRNGEVHYRELSIPVNYYIKNLNIKCPSLQWDIDSTKVVYDFESGIGSGAVNGTINFNMKSRRYEMQTVVSNFDLKVLEQYMKDFAAYGNLSAFLDANVRTAGNLNDKLEIMASGKMALRDFHFGKTDNDDYASFAKFSLNIDSIFPSHKKYFLSSLLIDSAYVKYEKYDYLDNFSLMFGKNGEQVSDAYASHQKVNIIFLIADYLSELAKNLINSQYRIDELKIINSRLLFNDYSLLQKFSATTDSIAITVRDIDSRKPRSFITLQSRLIPFGNLNVKFDVNTTDFGDFHLQYAVTDVPLPIFNPYLITYTSFPFNKGAIQIDGTWNVVNKQVKSANHISVINPSRVDKTKNYGTQRLPVPLLLGFVRDWHRKIDFEVPITGNLDDPNYHLRDVIFDVIANIFVKPPIIPYTNSKQQKKEEEEDHELLEWMPMQTMLTKDQKKQLVKISLFIIIQPKLHLSIAPKYFEQLEKEMIVLYEAKKEYYADVHHLMKTKLSAADSVEISKLSIKDSSFVKYLNLKADPTGTEFSVLGKCKKLIGQNEVNEKYKEIIAFRKKEIIVFFSNLKLRNRITFLTPISTIPRSGFSQDIFIYK